MVEKIYVAKESTSQEIQSTVNDIELTANGIQTDTQNIRTTTQSIRTAVQDALDVLGTSGDSGNNTVMGKLNSPNIIKSVQRGIFLTSKTGEDVTVSLATIVNPAKCTVNLQGTGWYYFSSAKIMDVGVFVKEITSKTLTVGMSWASAPSTVYQCSIGWEVVEYF